MNIDNITKIKKLRGIVKTLRTFPDNYKEKIKDSACDKYDFKFGGDDRFSVFKVTVFLDCHTGYYGNSGCSTFATIDSKDAQRLLNKVLNKKKDEILQLMADEAEKEALSLKESATKEIEELKSLINSLE